MLRFFIALCVSSALVALPIHGPNVYAKEKRIKYAKSEVDKAVGKCLASMAIGAVIGGLVAGKKDRGTGVLLGLGLGGVVCAVLVSSAKKKDRIIAAQLAAAQSDNGRYSERYIDDDGQSVTLVAQAGPIQSFSGSQLQPVRYKASTGEKIASPVLDTNHHECRDVPVEISYPNGNASGLPPQRTCRTPDGNWMPYSPVIA